MLPAANGPETILAGRYRIKRKLGEGATGIVWLVRDTRKRGQEWAVKELDFSVIPPNERAEALDLFDREASILMLLRHESLPRVEDRFAEKGREYLVMERVEGPTLDAILAGRDRPLGEGDVAQWGIQICRVLEYLHGRRPPVVYRDLKPSNVMVRVDGGIKLIDFGIARHADPVRRGDTAAYGTPGYAPPEQYAGCAEPRSDLYALGVTMYQLMTREDPQADGFRFLPLRQRNPRASEGMERLLTDLLRPRVEDRPASAADVRARLEELGRAPSGWWERVWKGLRGR